MKNLPLVVADLQRTRMKPIELLIGSLARHLPLLSILVAVVVVVDAVFVSPEQMYLRASTAVVAVVAGHLKKDLTMSCR